MALVKCPDCSGDVSSEALSCPHCARPFNTFQTFVGGLARFIAFACIVGITMRMCAH